MRETKQAPVVSQLPRDKFTKRLLETIHEHEEDGRGVVGIRTGREAALMLLAEMAPTRMPFLDLCDQAETPEDVAWLRMVAKHDATMVKVALGFSGYIGDLFAARWEVEQRLKPDAIEVEVERP